MPETHGAVPDRGHPALCGLALCFFGLRFWFLLLPLFSAIAGFYIASRGIQELTRTGWLSSAFSWFGGLVVAVGFALMSWFLWYAGVVLLAASLGALLVSGALHAQMPDLWGWVLVLVAASALAGAALTIVGVIMVIGSVTISELANGVAVTIVDEVAHQGANSLGILLWAVLALAGIAVQWQRTTSVLFPEPLWVPARIPQAQGS